MTVTQSNDSGSEVADVDQNLVSLTIDDVEVSVPEGTLVIRAAELIGVEIPRFCDHPLLAPVGACRQCLVDVPDAGNGRGFPKPQASCTLPVSPGMVVKTQVTSPVADKAQAGIMEFLLINHPLDCPMCDKGGECPLQNQALSHGRGETRFDGAKRTFAKPLSISPQILLDRERCVLCARCTRFSEQIAGDPFIAMAERGALQQVAIYENEPYSSYFSGNTIQICPVGALTSSAYRFRSRPFDLVSTPSVAEHDACGAAIRVDHRRGKVMRRLAGDDPEVNEEWISDKDRFAFAYDRQPDRLTRPLVRDPETGALEPASWPAAFAFAARGLLSAGGVGVLTGGRLPLEDAYAYAKLARTVLGTNDIDFRSRPHSEEEAAFLAHAVAGSGLGVTYSDLEAARTVVLVGLEPEDEAATSSCACARRGGPVARRSSRSPATRRGPGEGRRHAASGRSPVTRPRRSPTSIWSRARSCSSLGERLARVAGAFSAALALADRRGARLAWVPRRAGDRGAVDAGCLPTCCPADARSTTPKRAPTSPPPGESRRSRRLLAATPTTSSPPHARAPSGASWSAVWKSTTSPTHGRDRGSGRRPLRGQPRGALQRGHRRADVVLPVAPLPRSRARSSTGRAARRPFGAVSRRRTPCRTHACSPGSPRLRVATSASGPPARPRASRPSSAPGTAPVHRSRRSSPAARPAPPAQAVLDTWRRLIDDGRGQDGDRHYPAPPARPSHGVGRDRTGAPASTTVTLVLGTDGAPSPSLSQWPTSPTAWCGHPTNSHGLSCRASSVPRTPTS